MNPIIEINQSVNVLASFKLVNNQVKVMPICMHYRGRDIRFSTLGLCHPVRHGSRLHYIFDVSDGVNDYSLDFNTTTLTWILLTIIDGSSL